VWSSGFFVLYFTMGNGEGDTGLEEVKDCVKWLTRPEGIKRTVGNLNLNK